MKIDFSYTSQNNQAEIEYYNVRGQIVKTYKLSQLEKYVTDNDLNITSVLDSEGGTGMISDPNTVFSWKLTEIDITDYLDNNWRSVTEDFYNAMNPEEFKSKNTFNQKHV